MQPGQLSIAQFDYPLPDHRIAHFPLPNRDGSKLLVYKKGTIREDVFSNLADHLPTGAQLIFNDSRVVEARLIFQKSTGARIEIFCLEPDTRYTDITAAYAQTGHVYWKCLVGNASAWTTGMSLEKKTGNNRLIRAEIFSKEKDHFIIHLSWEPADYSFAAILHEAGVMPLPPYIKRKADAADAERYQTIYAHYAGSVAAPTAGLHFTDAVLDQLEKKNIRKDFVTLHVGAGTFKPVKSETIAGHEMHAEFFQVSSSLITNLIEHLYDQVIAVGTTSLRTLESLYWIGLKIYYDKNITAAGLHVTQWEPYEKAADISATDALKALLHWMQSNNTEILIGRTSLLIAPPYKFRIVTALVTNFHQPRSTLLLLVAAFIGDNWKSVYTYALEHDFRFLSYGDSCLFFRQ